MRRERQRKKEEDQLQIKKRNCSLKLNHFLYKYQKKHSNSTVRDDESLIELEELAGRTNRLAPDVMPGSTRIPVGNIMYLDKRQF
jgi:hypothetical protein